MCKKPSTNNNPTPRGIYIPNKFPREDVIITSPYLTQIPVNSPLYKLILDKLVDLLPGKPNKVRALSKVTPTNRRGNKIPYLCLDIKHLDLIVEAYSEVVIPLLKRSIIRDNLTTEASEIIPLVYYMADNAQGCNVIKENLSILIKAYDLIYNRNLWLEVKKAISEISKSTIIG